MTCEGCASRRARLAKWFRTLIGVEYMLAEMAAVNQVRFQKLETRVDQMTEAGTLLEQVMVEGFKATAKSLEDHKNNIKILMTAQQETVERVAYLRDSMHNQREELRKARDEINDHNSEVGKLAESVYKLEFPGFQPVDLSIEG